MKPADMPRPTPREAADAIFDMEDALHDTRDKLALLVEALTPRGTTLPQAGLHRMMGDMLDRVVEAIDLWDTAFHGTHDLRQAPPKPKPDPADPIRQLAHNAASAAEWARDTREAWAIDPGFMLGDT